MRMFWTIVEADQQTFTQAGLPTPSRAWSILPKMDQIYIPNRFPLAEDFNSALTLPVL
jgi:hypothetical protein